MKNIEITYPIIVKPVDRSGSRGITKLTTPEGLEEAIESAKIQGFDKHALVEEFATGQEYSVEFISWQGEHHFLAMTKKYTTGAPHFIETAHLEPAPISNEKLEEVKNVVIHALNSLEIQNGASHSELKISKDGRIAIIEIGGRMGGDCIGSNLVELSTGIDFVKAVIQVALGECPDLTPRDATTQAAIRFVLYFFIKSFENAFEPSRIAAFLRGPNTFKPSASNASTTPPTNGSSIPMIVKSIFSSFAKATNLSNSIAPIATHSATPAIPAFPGAQ